MKIWIKAIFENMFQEQCGLKAQILQLNCQLQTPIIQMVHHEVPVEQKNKIHKDIDGVQNLLLATPLEARDIYSIGHEFCLKPHSKVGNPTTK